MEELEKMEECLELNSILTCVFRCCGTTNLQILSTRTQYLMLQLVGNYCFVCVMRLLE